eukprot:364358_1
MLTYSTTLLPSLIPSMSPTQQPTISPADNPSSAPTNSPSLAPSVSPSLTTPLCKGISVTVINDFNLFNASDFNGLYTLITETQFNRPIWKMTQSSIDQSIQYFFGSHWIING